MRYRYSRWDGSQDPFGPEVDASDVLEELADDVLMGTGADNALRRLMRRGMQGRFSGLDAIRQRLNHMRRQEEEALDLTGPLEEVREQLEEILDRERSTLSFKAEDDARMRELFLDSLPPDAPGIIRELSDYRFVDPQAQQMFDQLMEHLREQVLGAYFRSMAEGMKNITPEQLAHFRDMLAELNQMIEQRARGDEYDFDGFMERYGDLFPDNPKSLDELLENMARRMAAMSRLMASLSAEQRAELQGLADQVMQDMDLAFEMSRLGSNLQGAFPNMPWGEPTMGGGEGDEPMPLSATVDAMERMHDYEDLDRALRGDYPGATVDDVDEEALQRILGEPAVRDLRRLKEVERALEKAGLTNRKDGRLEITPRGARKLGERALVQVFEELKRDREGTHEARDAGGMAEPTGATRPWRFGDTGQIAVQRTVFNAVVRSQPGQPIRLQPDDFELVEAEQRTEAATALLLDLSFSMPLRGHFVHAKKMALALHALDRRPLPARHALPDRVQRLRAAAAAGRPHRARVRARVRHEHAARVPARRSVARPASASRAPGDHGDRRRADGAPGRRPGVLLVAAGVEDDQPDAGGGGAPVEVRRHVERLHARGVGGPDRLHGTPRSHHVRPGVPDG